MRKISTYIDHKEFLNRGIIQKCYPINDEKSAERCVTEDIIDTQTFYESILRNL
jgi:hypothetical protein